MRVRRIAAVGITAAVVAGGLIGGQAGALAAASKTTDSGITASKSVPSRTLPSRTLPSRTLPSRTPLSTTLATDRTPGDDGLGRFREQKIIWHTCRTGPDDAIGEELDKAGAQCAEVTVPLDYAHPDDRTIKVAMSRLRATDAERRRGVLLINPGGPGDPGMMYAPLLKRAEPEVAARYDLIGMDVRLTGRSTPLNCHWPIGLAPGSAGPNRRTFDESVAQAKDLASRCAGQKDLLPHAATRNAARDMDVIRAALGESKISFIGGSGGTYLGAVYLQLFPKHADRFLLDSAVDPRAYTTGVGRPMGRPLASALKAWATWAARHHNRYHLGDTTAQVLATVDRINKAAGRLLRVGRHQVDAHIFPLILLFSLGRDNEESYVELAANLQVLSAAARGDKVVPPPSLDEGLTVLTSPEVGGAASAPMAILCADGSSSRDPETYYRDIRKHRAEEPLFGPLARAMHLPCAFWPATAAEPPVRIHNDVPVLMVGSTGDPKTPYPGQQVMHRALTGSRLVAVRGAARHLVYGPFPATRNACVESAANRYLLDGVLPSTDITCADTTSKASTNA